MSWSKAPAGRWTGETGSPSNAEVRLAGWRRLQSVQLLPVPPASGPKRERARNRSTAILKGGENVPVRFEWSARKAGTNLRKAKELAAGELRSGYKGAGFVSLVRGKHSERLRAGSNVVVLDPEVADLFPNAAAVNAALRLLADIAKRVGSRRNRH